MDAQAKQQVIERVKQANNILVTVSTDPSVDQLASCIGLTLMLNKMQKHATAVFSGKVPSTIEFLQPEKTLETNTDSLQDFIISLDKNKADKLRYKVEDEFVRIFITPYRTKLTEKDLQFSYGDFNVEVVVALGVKEKAQIDAAIAAHGRILHDATVISVNVGQGNAPDLGQINWQDPGASSLSEMLVSISEAFGSGLIDNQIATAFLTGIVAETNRFGNEHTSPKVMTMSAQLMAAGANQQLIAKQLEPPPPLVPAIPAPIPAPEQHQEEKEESSGEMAKPVDEPGKEGTLSVSHKENEASSPEVEFNPAEIRIDDQGNLKTAKTALDGQDEAKEMDKDKDLSAAHSLLDPKDAPATASFTASAQPEWQNSGADKPLDPLSDVSEKGELMDHTAEVKPPEHGELNPIATPETPAEINTSDSSVDSARDAVQSALATAPFDPATAGPVEALNAQPIAENLHEEPSKPEDNKDKEQKGDITPPAPPPVPPPLTFDAEPATHHRGKKSDSKKD